LPCGLRSFFYSICCISLEICERGWGEPPVGFITLLLGRLSVDHKKDVSSQSQQQKRLVGRIWKVFEIFFSSVPSIFFYYYRDLNSFLSAEIVTFTAAEFNGHLLPYTKTQFNVEIIQSTFV